MVFQIRIRIKTIQAIKTTSILVVRFQKIRMRIVTTRQTGEDAADTCRPEKSTSEGQKTHIGRKQMEIK